MNKLLTLSLVLFLAAGCGPTKSEAPNLENHPTPSTEAPSTQTLDFSKINASYRFSAEIPSSWKTEYVASIDSINIYNPAGSGDSSLEQSVIFIRNFSANNFLTLNTVDILSREEVQVKGHAAVKYEIIKKSGIPNFTGQPTWRNSRHKLIDIRYNESNPSIFYVFAYTPDLPEVSFETFVKSLVFHNDK